jgi:putative transposase
LQEATVVLSRDDLLTIYQRLGLSDQAQAVIDDVRCSDPARRVRSGRSNVSGRYPSKKMGVTIQFESHRVELAAIYEMEHDIRVIEYFDQPPSIKLLYDSPSGRRMGVMHTPDFFVIRADAAGWEEWKPEEELTRLAEKNLNRYQRDSGDKWWCPPGEAYARALGLNYRVRSAREIDWIFQRNMQFLDDYLRTENVLCATTVCERLLGYLRAAPGLSLEELFRLAEGVAGRDEIYGLIATGTLSVDLRKASLSEPADVPVFAPGDDQLREVRAEPDACRRSPRNLIASVGRKITWDGRPWRLVNLGETAVSLLSDEGTVIEMPFSAFQTLAASGGLQGLAQCREDSVDPELLELLSKASDRELTVANSRCRIVRGHFAGESCDELGPVPARTLRRWTARYRAAQRRYGSGYLGLLPRTRDRGNQTERLPEKTRQLVNDFIDGDYESLKQKTMYASWIGLKRECEARNMPAPSYKTFTLKVHQKAGFQQTLKRQGRRAAYAQEPFYLDLDLKTPRHGDRPFEIGHIDHTELDVEVISSCTGQVLGRPWLTLLTDAFSRRVLAFYVTFDAPSYRSCMMILRECVRRHERLPQFVVLDGGREFNSIYFETLLARYECTKKTRPPAKARFGSVCERMFGTANTHLVHNLLGNTQITRNVRQVTKSVNPEQHATWPLPELFDRLSDYFYEVYDTIAHPALGQSPREAYERGMAATGTRPQKQIAYDLEFQIWTLPTTAKGTAKVSPGRSVKINYLYYWSEALREPAVERREVAVRYDPFDIGTAYAFAGDRWVRCVSEHYLLLRGRSEKEVALASTELRQRNQCHSQTFEITANKLAAFLASVESEGALLLQRLRDREGQVVRDRSFGVVDNRETDACTTDPKCDADGSEDRRPAAETCEIYGEF